MSKRIVSRRDFLRASALAAAGAALTACAPAAQPAAAPAAPKPTDPPAPTNAPAAPATVTLDVVHDTPEYDNTYRQIFDVFEQENPGIKVQVLAHSEDGQAAFNAKIAGGYFAAMETVSSMGNATRINQDNYQNYVDLSTIGFPYWDLWTFDVKNAWSNMYNLPGPRSLSPFLGWVNTWVWHEDIMQKAELNPRADVKTWDDLKTWLDKGTKWAKSNGYQFFWDQGWLPDWFGGTSIMDCIPLAFGDGQNEKQVACWKGDMAFNAKDSPYRHTFEFFVEAYQKEWVPKSFWTREWETDMEASYAAKKSVVQLHGPWIWDKAVATDANAKQSGMPATPPADSGVTQPMQWMSDLEIDAAWNSQAFAMRAGNEKAATWEQAKKLFTWWNSPDTVKMRAEAIGALPAVKLDPPAEINAPQYQGIIKEIGTSGGAYENFQFQTNPSGEAIMAPKRKTGSPGVWDYESGNNAKYWADLMEGKMTVQEVLDLAQKNWEASYK